MKTGEIMTRLNSKNVFGFPCKTTPIHLRGLIEYFNREHVPGRFPPVLEINIYRQHLEDTTTIFHLVATLLPPVPSRAIAVDGREVFVPGGKVVDVGFGDVFVTPSSDSIATVKGDCGQPYPSWALAYLDALGRFLRTQCGIAGAQETTDTVSESGHFAWPREKRREIVEQYRDGRQRGEIENKDAWAQANHGITGRTLLNYEREFPEET